MQQAVALRVHPDTAWHQLHTLARHLACGTLASASRLARAASDDRNSVHQATTPAHRTHSQMTHVHRLEHLGSRLLRARQWIMLCNSATVPLHVVDLRDGVGGSRSVELLCRPACDRLGYGGQAHGGRRRVVAPCNDARATMHRASCTCMHGSLHAHDARRASATSGVYSPWFGV